MSGAFQSDAFQSDAFQTDSGVHSTDNPTLSDVAVVVVSAARTAADNPTFSDVANLALNEVSATDAPYFSDTASVLFVRARTAADSTTVAGVATRTGSFLRTIDQDIRIDDGVARIVNGSTTSIPGGPITPPPGGPTPPTGPLDPNPIIRYGIVITVDGTDITDEVVIDSSSFVSMVNGQQGSCSIKVKDPNRDKSFTTGVRITLDIAGNRVWAGYLAAVKRSYAFAYHSTQTRFLILDGVDVNILFHKRFVEYLSSPTRMLGPVYPDNTKDITAIHDLIGGWLDLSGDDLTTGAYIENVGDVNIDQRANLWQAGWDWGSAMSTIARLTQAIYYITPDRHLVYTDVNTATAPYEMSDTPTATQISYRDMTIDHDGSNMINDALIWGVGGGSPTPVFKRLTSAASTSTHGVWQYGATYQGVYKQATLDRIADSLVNGSPLSKRGAKYDRVAVQLTTFTPGFLPAQKIDFSSEAFGFTDVIPVRRMEVTFPGGNPRYRLTLSHEIDQPFSLFDIVPIAPVNFNFPGFDPIPPLQPPPIGNDCECGTTDSFNRPDTTGGWGTSDSSLEWTVTQTGSPAGVASIQDSRGHFLCSATTSTNSSTVTATLAIDPTRMSFDFRVDQLTTSQPSPSSFANTSTVLRTNVGSFGLLLVSEQSGPTPLSENLILTTVSNSSSIPFTPLIGVTYHVIWEIDLDSETRVKVYSTDEPPDDWDLVVADTPSLGHLDTFQLIATTGGSGSFSSSFPFEGDFWNFDASGADGSITRCSETRFDNFDRTVAVTSWGVSSYGLPWSIHSRNNAFSSASVASGQGKMTWPSTHGGGSMSATTDAGGSASPWISGKFTMTAVVSFTAASFNSLNISMGLRDSNVTGLDQYFDWRPTSGEVDVLTDSGSYFEEGLFTPVASGTYVVIWDFEMNVVSRFTFYPIDGINPGWLVTEVPNSGTAPTSATRFGVNVGTGFGFGGPSINAVIAFESIDFEYEGQPCYQAGPDDNPGLPASGQLSEFAARVTGTTYQLSRQVVAGSELITINGVVQDPSTYTVNTTTGLITFTSSVDPADSVYVVYTANGIISGTPPTESIPAGGNFTLVFDDQFDRTIAEGHFLDGGSSYTAGAAFYKTADGRYGVFKDGWKDTSTHGRYDPSIISVHDGYLDLHLQTTTKSDGTWPRVATLTCLPTGSSAKGGLLGGRMRIVARADLMLHYKGVPLWWADLATTNILLEQYGEIDWPEASFDAVPHGFMHRTNATSLSDQYVGIPVGSPSWQDWHEYITEWIPGTSVKWFLDGVQVGVTQTSRVPTVPMHFNLQFETALGGEPAPSPSTSGHVQIAEVQVWRYDP